MINQFFSYLLEASICMAIFYLFFRLLLWKEVFFVWNRMYILGTLALSLIIPAINIPLQTTQGIALQEVFVIQLQGTTVTSSGGTYSFSWQEWILYIYLSISLLLLGKLAFQITKLWYYSRNFSASRATNYKLILTEGKLPTFSFFKLFFWDNSQDISETDKAQILKHELTHIRQWHSADILFVEIVKAFFWFHPAVYLFKQSVQQVHEYLADAAVVQQYPAGNYIQLLVSQTLHTQSISISTSFHQPPIKNRIYMLQKLKQARPAFWKIALSLPIIVALVFVYSCQKSDLSDLQVDKNITSTKSQLTIEEILEKYRSKYPNITVGDINMFKNPDGTSNPRLTIKNVDNITDKLKIEEEISQAAQAFLASQLAVSPPPTAPNAPDAPLAEEIFQEVDEQPTPVRGYDTFFKYISENISYPQEARLKGIEGKVFVQFVVHNDGSIRNVQVLKGIGSGCDAEAVKVITNAPKWNPGMKNGQPVNVRMAVPIAFKLN
ncbi:TonB family protein [Rhodocytophaga rosea]|uniref:TonB family protein n=1 Tax=Rhodocytophaga rosea TaxID=2704465 RepID=A0A6C0GJ49_9BACT|nr:TonB family protein [Rhodocytophaga rosea]QHT67692.1 TonB family protein [Rhodocytophaga rosea]